MGATLPQEESHSGTGLSRDIPIIENVYRGHVTRSLHLGLTQTDLRGTRRINLLKCRHSGGTGTKSVDKFMGVTEV